MSTYKLAPNVRWAVDRFTVKVTGASGGARTLQYPEAAVWDLVSRGYPFAKVVAMITHIAGVDEAGADALVRASLDDWSRNGYIEAGAD